MRNRRNYYRVLHVQPDAPVEIIRTSYRTLMQRLRMHPDLGGDHWNAALINEAFEVLANPERRAAYDALLAAKSAGARAAAARGAGARGSQTHLALPGPATAACAFCGTLHAARETTVRGASCASCGSPLYPAVTLLGEDRSRRALDRVPARLPVEFCVSWPATRLFTGISADLSIAGMRLTTSLELVVHERLRVDCEFCSGVGEVRRVTRREDGSWDVGIEFLTLRIKRTRGSLISTDV